MDIIDGRRTVQDARPFYAETAAAFALGRSAPYAETLLFTPPAGETGEPDEALISDHLARQTFEMVRDVMGLGRRPE